MPDERIEDVLCLRWWLDRPNRRRTIAGTGRRQDPDDLSFELGSRLDRLSDGVALGRARCHSPHQPGARVHHQVRPDGRLARDQLAALVNGLPVLDGGRIGKRRCRSSEVCSTSTAVFRTELAPEG